MNCRVGGVREQRTGTDRDAQTGEHNLLVGGSRRCERPFQTADECRLAGHDTRGVGNVHHRDNARVEKLGGKVFGEEDGGAVAVGNRGGEAARIAADNAGSDDRTHQTGFKPSARLVLRILREAMIGAERTDNAKALRLGRLLSGKRNPAEGNGKYRRRNHRQQ